MSSMENAHGGQDRGREKLPEESERKHEHQVNHAAATSRQKPSFEFADGYHGVFLELIPLLPRQKIPADRRWQKNPYEHNETLARAKREGLNLGVRLRPDVVVIDVDPRNFPVGHDSLAELAKAVGLDLSTAPHVLTGNLEHQGHHYYFRKPAGVVLLESVEGFEGVELKSAGRQVVAAGSVHPTGGMYRWAPDSPPLHEMPELPTRLVEMARRPDRPAGGGAGAGELTPELLAKTLEQLDPCDFGKGEHGRWVNLMMACHHATDGQGRQEFIDWSMGDPEYNGQEWKVGYRWDSLHTDRRETITTATLQMLLNEVGGRIAALDPEDDFEVWDEADEPAQPGQKQPRWRFLSLDELEALPPPQWLIPGVLTEGSLAAIYGAPESGKSFLAVDMSMSIAGGIDWHGSPVEQGAVLYIAAEGAPGLGKRVRAWRQDRRAQGSGFKFHLMRDEINFAAEKEGPVLEFVKTVSDELGPLKLIVIDTLNQTAAGADENSAKDMSRYIASMKRLRDATGAAVVVVHHSGKDVSKGMRGSTALLGAMDTTIEVDRNKDRHSITLKVQKQKDAEREGPFRFNLEKVADSLVLKRTAMGDAASDFEDKAGPSDGLLALACELGAAAGTLKVGDLVDAAFERLDMKESSAKRAVNKELPEGHFNRVRANWDGRDFWLWCERVGSHPTAAKVVLVQAV